MWAGNPFQCCPVGVFQLFRSIFVSQFQKGQAALIGLFFNPVGIKNPQNHLAGRFTDTGCPFEEPFFIPFAVQLMVDRHMLWDCEILPTAPLKTLVAADPVPLVVNLNTASGIPDIHFFAYIFIRDRVVLQIYSDMK